MSRSTLSPSKTPMKRSAITRRTGIKRRPSPKRRKKQREWNRITREAIAAVNGFCVVRSSDCTQWATDGHHRLKSSQGGKNTLENCVPCCRRCHDFLEAHPATAVVLGFSIRRSSSLAAAPGTKGEGRQ